MRPDAFVDAFLNYITGRSLLIEAKIREIENTQLNDESINNDEENLNNTLSLLSN